jgi:LytTr DNA-binding domain
MWRVLFTPKYQNWRWALALSAGLYFFLFILFFEPFKGEIFTYAIPNVLECLLAMSSVVFFNSVFSVIILPKYFPEYFIPDNFTLNKFIILIGLTALSITVIVFFVDSHYNKVDLTFSWFFIFLFKMGIPTIIMAIIPFLIAFFLVFDYFTNIEKQEEAFKADNDALGTFLFEENEKADSPSQKGTPQYKSDFKLAIWHNLFKPEYQNWRWVFCLSLGIYIHLFINVCEPYKGDKVTYIWASFESYALHSLINFLNVLCCSSIACILLPKLFPKFFLPENFTFTRFLLLISSVSIVMGICYFIGNYYFFNYEVTLSWFLIYIFKVIATNALFAGLPFVITFLFILNYYIDNNEIREEVANDADDTQLVYHPENAFRPLTAMAPHHSEGIKADNPIMLRFSDNSNKKPLDIALNNLYYITSAQNYVEVFYQNEDAIKSTLLRNSLKAIEEEMITNTDLPLVRCHKAFIVNSEKVVELRGPAKAAQFILRDIDTSIPVSRQRYPELDSRFPNTMN